jgi:hypothetical protein
MIPINSSEMRRVRLSVIVAVAVFVAITTGVFAQARAGATITLGPVKDNTLYESSSGALSNGAGAYMFVGKTDNSALIRRAVIAFDPTSVPIGATIDSVTLNLNMSRTTSGSQTVTLHKLQADWGEGTSDALGNEGGGTS